jgi:hypothetical protein
MRNRAACRLCGMGCHSTRIGAREAGCLHRWGLLTEMQAYDRVCAVVPGEQPQLPPSGGGGGNGGRDGGGGGGGGGGEGVGRGWGWGAGLLVMVATVVTADALVHAPAARADASKENTVSRQAPTPPPASPARPSITGRSLICSISSGACVKRTP